MGRNARCDFIIIANTVEALHRVIDHIGTDRIGD